jgi:hypothetical protein
MSKGAKSTSGIGAKIARNTQCTSTQNALGVPDHVMVYVANARKKKITKTA